MTELFAQPYDITAQGFYFKTHEEYQEKSAKARNSSGFPVEEYEIQFTEIFDQITAYAGGAPTNIVNPAVLGKV